MPLLFWPVYKEFDIPVILHQRPFIQASALMTVYRQENQSDIYTLMQSISDFSLVKYNITQNTSVIILQLCLNRMDFLVIKNVKAFYNTGSHVIQYYL